MGRLDGKVALVSGGARGMGRSHVRHFVSEGARVVFGDVLDDEGKAVAAEVGDAACYVHLDVTSEADWAAAVRTATDTFGELHVLVNNAGILRHATIADMPLDEFRHVLDVNLVGTWLGIKAVIAPMTAAGGGSIVNISSIEGVVGAAGLSAYSASKFAVRGVTKTAAQELGILLLGERYAPQRGPHHRSHRIPVLPSQIDARVEQRQSGCGDAESSEPVEPAGSALLQMIRRDKIVHLRRDAALERGRVEPGHALHCRARLPQPRPELFCAGPDRCDCSYTGNDNPAKVRHTRSPLRGGCLPACGRQSRE